MPRWRDVVIAGMAGTLAALGEFFRVGRPRYRLRLPAREIFVGNHSVGPSGYITVARFPGDADANVAPTSELYVNHALAVARDGHGNIYVASDTGNQVRVYAPGTVGTAPAPLRTIQGTDTKLHRPSGLAVDRQGNLYVAERGGPTHASAVLKFAPGADGNVAPISVIPSRMPPPGDVAATNTRIDIASGVALDYDGSIYVVTCPEFQRGGESKLLRFDPGANGDVAPVAEITMGLSEPQQVTLTSDGRIYVTNRGGNPSITVHAPEPAADVAPTRTPLPAQNWSGPLESRWIARTGSSLRNQARVAFLCLTWAQPAMWLRSARSTDRTPALTIRPGLRSACSDAEAGA